MRQLFTESFSRSPKLVVGTVAISMLIALMEGVGLGLILPIVEGISTPEEVAPGHVLSQAIFDILSWFGLPFSTTVLVLVGLVLFAAQSLLILAKTMTILYLRVSVELGVRSELFSSFFATRVSYFDDQRLGRLSNAVVIEASRTGAAVVHLMEAVVTAILVVGYFVIAALISWQLALLTLVLIGVGGTATRRTAALRNRGRKITVANAEMESTAVEYLSAIREVNALGLKAHSNQLFGRAAIRAGLESFGAERFVAAFRLGYEIAAVVVTAGLLGVGVLLLDLETAAVVAFFVLLFRLAPRMVLLQNLLYKFVSAQPGYEEVRGLSDEAKRQVIPDSGAKIPAGLRERIEFKDVRFSYDGRTDVLDGLNLEISRGTTVGVIGVSGAGKSTLIDLLLRLADPTAGAILVDGVDLRELDLEAWRSMIGFVGQETFLFHDTIRRNLELGRPDVAAPALEAAAARAGAQEFIGSLPSGLDTVVGERGAMLSGGQRQRLALARALVREPEILLLDEATSDLDSRSQALIQDSLREMHGQRTVIIVAHRLSTVRDADVIIALDGGKVVESGTHEELLRLGGIYAEFSARETRGA